MAQTRKRRRRKHRGTQGGSIDRRRGRGRPRSREEARAQARRRSESRRDLPPTWRSAFTRGLFGAGIFLLLMVLLFSRPFGEALLLSAVMLALYVPMGYYIDRFFWRRRRAQAHKAAATRKP
jgi:drug/metabolite transporter (DMT)-like permease